ncbi:MAG: NAD(P)H-dependent oxidoreductase [Pseudomonadota bacterium]
MPRAHLVHAHPEPASFVAAMRDTAQQRLAAQGYEVTLSDLYAQGFDPVASGADFPERERPDYLNYALEQRHAIAADRLAPDIRREVEAVRQADLLVLSFPLYWFAMPAILKGWIDRVFVSGLFYGGKRIYARGGMAGRKALVIAALGGREHMFGPGALHGELETMLRPLLQGTLGYVGYEVLKPFFAHHVPYLPPGERSALLARLAAELDALAARPRLPMPDLARYDEIFRPLPQTPPSSRD